MAFLPLRCVARLSGDAGAGPGPSYFFVTEKGVVVNRRGRVSLFARNLTSEKWHHKFDGWGSVPIPASRSVFLGPIQGSIREYALDTGDELRRTAYAGSGTVKGIAEKVYLLAGGAGVDAVDLSGTFLWRHDAPVGHALAAQDRFIVSEDLERTLVCLDANRGQVVWRFIPPPMGGGDSARRSQTMPMGFPSVTVSGGRLVAITMDFRVFVLSLQSGEVLLSSSVSATGVPALTAESIFFIAPHGYVEITRDSLTEVVRADYRDEVAPLYGSHHLTINAACVHDAAIVWTTMDGAVMAIERDKIDGRWKVWSDEVPDALMPLGIAPQAHDGHVYVAHRGPNPELLCYESVARHRAH